MKREPDKRRWLKPKLGQNGLRDLKSALRIEQEVVQIQEVLDMDQDDFLRNFRDSFGDDEEKFEQWFNSRMVNIPADFIDVVRDPEGKMTQREKEMVEKSLGDYACYRP